MTEALIGLDVGGTKTAIRAEGLDGRLLFTEIVPSADWDAEPVASGARWIDAVIRRVVPDELDIVALGIGAQGLDSAAIFREFEAALAVLGRRARAVNDAALLVPAAGVSAGIGIISGTGAIGVGADDAGEFLVTGGWGWVIGDEGGASGLVREASRRALLAHDDGDPDDGLLGALLKGFGVVNAERLARAVNDEPTMENWGSRAESIFEAAGSGSALARASIDAAADHLVHLVTQLVRRGAAGADVVAAGGLISNQESMWVRFSTGVRLRHPELAPHLLDCDPVVGAVALARDLTVRR